MMPADATGGGIGDGLGAGAGAGAGVGSLAAGVDGPLPDEPPQAASTASANKAARRGTDLRA
ncbi:MAG: hypothetical protein AAFY84_03045 [Pseudomonadota bacterium]